MKSYCIRFSLHDISVEQFTALLQGAWLTWFNKIKHLGHTLLAMLNDSEEILFVSKVILRFNLFISCLDSVTFLYRLKYIYFRTFVTHFSAVSYGTYRIEAFVNLTFYSVKQLEGYGIFLTLLIATYSQHLLLEIIFVLLFITNLLISRVIVLVVIMNILNLLRFLLLSRKCTFLVKTYFICHI